MAVEVNESIKQAPLGYLRKSEAAKYLRVSIRTMTTLMRRHKVPFIKLTGRLCLFRMSDLDRALDRFRIKAVGE